MMDFFADLLGAGLPSNMNPHMREEIDRLMNELVGIGQKDDFLSERPGGQFNMQCHHVRARAIGKRLHELGGLALMERARRLVKRKLKANMASHLDYCWSEIGDWKP
ncbi:MAG TPA: hypothetical protein PKW33_08230 [Anaerolineaceae bacterium]|nr:hypothetical protein [Anaerolineaceae bacterium]HPN51560.1 hypothetical protein [Anaerolineaceae bacterium]